MSKVLISSIFISTLLVGTILSYNHKELIAEVKHDQGCYQFHQNHSLVSFSGGWNETDSTNKTGYHWTKFSVNHSDQNYIASIEIENVGEFISLQSQHSSYIQSPSNIRASAIHYHRLYKMNNEKTLCLIFHHNKDVF